MHNAGRTNVCSSGTGDRKMKLDSDNLKIVLQKQGRLAKPCREILKSAGLDFEFYDGRLFAPCQNFPLDILFLRDDDIPEYVQDGVADLGIVGLNVVQEKAAQVIQLDALGFGTCTLSIAVPRKSSISSVYDLEGKRIATSHPRILEGFLDQRKVKARVIQISGSVERPGRSHAGTNVEERWSCAGLRPGRSTFHLLLDRPFGFSRWG